MDKFIKIKEQVKLLDDQSINLICDQLISSSILSKQDLMKIVEKFNLGSKFIESLYEIKKIDYKIKQNEFMEFVKKNPNIQLNFIEDWKDSNKIKITKMLICLDYLNNTTLPNFIGNKSKKTYSNGEVINDCSLSLRKFFSPEFKSFDTIFYQNLISFTNKLITNNENLTPEIMNNWIHETIQIVQSEIICRDKFNNNQLDNYKNKIVDIVNTRKQEENLYNLYYKLRFKKLLSDPNNYALKYLIDTSWSETKLKYPWLTHLITFINNGSVESKKYLVETFNIDNFEGDSYEIKKTLVHTIIPIILPNTQNINEITNFIFKIGTYFKHTTYYKWYNKELNKINFFEKYNSKTFEENLDNQINILNLNLEDSSELKNMIENYYNLLEVYI